MALADYFERNAQAASALIQGFDAGLLAARLRAEVIGIAVDRSVESSAEGQAAVDLAVRLLARVYPTLAIVGLGSARKRHLDTIRSLARSINPKLDLVDDLPEATKLLVFGDTAVSPGLKSKEHTWYVGSDNWIARLSMRGPVGSKLSANPIGAGVAACVGVANVFRAVFVEELGEASFDTDLSSSIWNLRPATAKTPNPVLKPLLLDDVHLVGAGAIGHGALWALSRMRCKGDLHIVDPEKVSDSNLQRYVMLVDGDQTKVKAELARNLLAPAFSATAHESDWSNHVGAIADHKVKTVLCAVDSAKARIQVQASLPRTIFNAWTQRGEAGVSRHQFLGRSACLACLYLPVGHAVNEDLLVTRALRLPEDEPTVRDVRRRLQSGVPTEQAFLTQVATASGVGLQKLQIFENRPLRELYVDGVCGGQVVEFHQAALNVKAEVPMGFQSALAGILLVAELARGHLLPHTVTQIDLLGTFPDAAGTPRLKTTAPRCLCLDEDFIEVYKAKYAA